MCRLEPEDLSKVRRRQSYEVHLESSAKKVSLSLSSLPSSRPPLSWTRSPSPITSPPSSRPLPPPPCSSHPSKPPPFAASRTIKCVLLKAPLLSWKSESQIIGRILWKSLSKSFLSHSLVIKLIQMNIQHLQHPGHPHILLMMMMITNSDLVNLLNPFPDAKRRKTETAELPNPWK